MFQNYTFTHHQVTLLSVQGQVCMFIVFQKFFQVLHILIKTIPIWSEIIHKKLHEITISQKIPITTCRNVAHTLHNPQGRTLYEKGSQGQLKVVMSQFPRAIWIWLYPLKPSRKEKKCFLERVSKILLILTLIQELKHSLIKY